MPSGPNTVIVVAVEWVEVEYEEKLGSFVYNYFVAFVYSTYVRLMKNQEVHLKPKK